MIENISAEVQALTSTESVGANILTTEANAEESQVVKENSEKVGNAKRLDVIDVDEEDDIFYQLQDLKLDWKPNYGISSDASMTPRRDGNQVMHASHKRKEKDCDSSSYESEPDHLQRPPASSFLTTNSNTGSGNFHVTHVSGDQHNSSVSNSTNNWNSGKLA